MIPTSSLSPTNVGTTLVSAFVAARSTAPKPGRLFSL